MIRSIYFTPGHELKYDLKKSEAIDVIHSGAGLLWVILQDAQAEEIADVLRDTFQFHPLTIEDCESVGYQTPKVDDFEEHMFILSHALIRDGEDLENLNTQELDMFLGKNYVVCSYRTDTMPPVDHIWTRLEKDRRLIQNGADFLCHAILDALVDDYMPLIDKMDEEIEWLEDRVLEKPNPETLQRILALKHSTLTLRRIVAPQREIMNRLSRDEFSLITANHRIYFRDIYDHLVRIQDLAESVRDIVSGTLDIYLSATSNRLNEVMKALTIVSTIFLPLTFIAGVYGMNFKYFPEINWQYGYLYVWILFAAILIAMLLFFRKRGWI
jgi:magnesium transporter